MGVAREYSGEEGERSWPRKCSLHHAQSPAGEEVAASGTQLRDGFLSDRLAAEA